MRRPVDDTAAAPDRNIALIMCAVFAPGRVINFGSSRRETYRYDLGGLCWILRTLRQERRQRRERRRTAGGWVGGYATPSQDTCLHVRCIRPGPALGSSSRCYCASELHRPAVCKLFRALN